MTICATVAATSNPFEAVNILFPSYILPSTQIKFEPNGSRPYSTPEIFDDELELDFRDDLKRLEYPLLDFPFSVTFNDAFVFDFREDLEPLDFRNNIELPEYPWVDFSFSGRFDDEFFKPQLDRKGRVQCLQNPENKSRS